jgi:predicted SnoaL-like aldol condensation-catalyzing enzyme
MQVGEDLRDIVLMMHQVRHTHAARQFLRQGAIALAILPVLVSLSASQPEPLCGAARQLDQNKALVENFILNVLGARSIEAAAKYLRPDYIQHNPGIPGGLAGFQDYFRPRFAQASTTVRLEILHVVAEGDLVDIHVRWFGTNAAGKPVDITEFDLFRVEGGLIAEHWDAIGP